ncbi:MAG TPA: exonuclease domain-containing protein, partial [Burkholderiales bacterium]|nr:exonuclease domain-containing protein [Burkholderiales bacterium]
MAAELNRLCWLDMEMSGLVPDSDRILELALLVTDSDLNHLSEGKVLVVHQPDEVLGAMDSWNKSVHGKSGLIE